MNKYELLEEMKVIADENGVGLTENAEKIASFRAKAKIPLNICPCEKDVPSPYRGCIGLICMNEIKEYGVCKCNAFCKKV